MHQIYCFLRRAAIASGLKKYREYCFTMSVPDTAPSMPSEETIEKIVRGFYAKARTDDEIGPIFARAIGDWEPHLSKMCDFWSSVMRTSGRYHGNPMLAHLRLKSVQP